MADIIKLQHYADALRNTGYKNSESALAEIIDNSVEAGARNIHIIATQSLSKTSGRATIAELAIYDDGTGMSRKELAGCLSIGESTRRERKGMGRFGVGLPQASMHVAPRVEVYSWQKGFEPHMVFLDVEAVKKGHQKEIQDPEGVSFPKDYTRILEKQIKVGISESGTLVVWKNCDRLNPKSPGPLFKRFEVLLGRKFRYFLQPSKENPDPVSIWIHTAGDSQQTFKIRPNDPLFLMEDNIYKAHESNPAQLDPTGHSIFELWTSGDRLGEFEHSVDFFKNGERRKGTVKIKYSWAKRPFRSLDKRTQVGDAAKKNQGISIVRANREIDFGKFDFYDDENTPQHRWWGCEIRFEPELDEFFGVANNKQQVELYHLDREDYDEEDVKPAWLQLEHIVKADIGTIYRKIRSEGEGKRSSRRATSSEEQLVNQLERDNTAMTHSRDVRGQLPEEEVRNLVKEHISRDHPDPSEAEIEEAVKNFVNLDKYDYGDTSMFMEVRTDLGSCFLTINTGSVFYRKLYSKLEEGNDEALAAMNLVLMAFARAEDEAYGRDPRLKRAFADVREEWGRKIRRYLEDD